MQVFCSANLLNAWNLSNQCFVKEKANKWLELLRINEALRYRRRKNMQILLNNIYIYIGDPHFLKDYELDLKLL